MNATQGKAVLAITERALWLLERSGHPMASHEADQLRARLVEATKAVKHGKCVLCDGAMNPADSVEGFLARKLKPGLAHETCARAYRQAAAEFKTWCRTPKIVVEFDAEKMALCACGHPADRHEHDELDNLLICLECDTCDHFHYDNSDAQEEAA